MQNLLSPYKFLNVEFLNAVDGRKFTEKERDSQFDMARCIKRYGRELSGGEIGCTLSHRKFYRELLKSDQKYALVFEDDIHPIRDISILEQFDLNKLLDTSTPTVLYLSGDYWFYKQNEPIVNVFSGLGTYAYMINRAAAQKILSIDNIYPTVENIKNKTYPISTYLYCVTLKSNQKENVKKLKEFLLSPQGQYIMEMLGSEVNQYSWGINRKKMSWSNILHSYRTGIIKRILKATGHFESKIKVRDGQIVPGLR